MAITTISEVKNVKINTDCIENPVYLRWFNSLGGWDCWVFGKMQVKTMSVGDSETSKKYTTTLSNYDNPLSRHSFKATESWRLGVDALDKTKYAAIFGVLRSPCVQLLMNPNDWQNDGAKFQNVIVKDSSVEIEDTNNNQISLEFEILIQELNTQSYV